MTIHTGTQRNDSVAALGNGISGLDSHVAIAVFSIA